MKHLLTLSILLICFSAVFGQTQTTPATQAANPAEVLKLKEVEHDFGQIPQGKPVYYNFEIVNTGSTP